MRTTRTTRTTRNPAPTPDQIKVQARLIEAEDSLAADQQRQHRNELREADSQYQKARAAGDRVRCRYWSDVTTRIRQGEALATAMRAEHDRHDGPKLLTQYRGQPCFDRDLDHWFS